jgi:hypothetical protein
MTQRERNLAVVLIGILLAGGGLLVAKFFYFDPAGNLRTQLDGRDQELIQRRGELAGEKKLAKDILTLSPRLAQYKKLSLPQSTNTSPEAIKTHNMLLIGEYQKNLHDLLVRCNFGVQRIKGAELDNRSNPTTAAKKPIYTTFRYDLEGDSDLASLVKVFQQLYEEPFLSQVYRFESAPIDSKSTREATQLHTKMVIDVLLVIDAEKRDPLTQLKPKFSGEGDDKKPEMLASGRRYQDIARKNIFAPPAPPKPDTTPEAPTRNTEATDDVYPFVKLTQIAFSDYYGVWTARIRNQGNRNDSALLAAGPLPPDCQFMRKHKELEKQVEEMKKADETLRKGNLSSRLSQELQEKVREGLAAENALAEFETPVNQWEVKDQNKEILVGMQIVRIDPLCVIFQANGKLHRLNLDNSMQEAMSVSLDKAEIDALGLTAGKDSALAKVVLKELKFRKDRNDQKGAYEGHFVNGDNKDEKATLSDKELPEELVAPDLWQVKDRFGTKLVEMKIAMMDKERAIFLADKKYYSIKQGSNLAEAMKKPLSEAEIKELKLETP